VARDHEWDYVVRLDAAWNLNVEADFAPFTGNLEAERGAEAFVDRVAVATGSGEKAASRADSGWAVDCSAGCRLRYRFRLAEAARTSRDVDLAIFAGGAYFAPPSTWLLRPESPRGQGSYRFRVEVPAGVRFATGVRPSASSLAEAFQGPVASFDESSFAGFGSLKSTFLPDSGLTVVIAPEMSLADGVLVEWARREAAAVDAYLGRTGDGRAVVFLVPGSADGTRGETLGGGGASAFIRLGQGVREENLYDDWVLAHELIHARFPSVRRTHAWFSEGLASYVEPLARVRAGLLDEHKMWADLVAGMPQGLPGPNDRGLDGNGEWGRVYWGGALYFLRADVEIRARTRGEHSLESALRAVIATGANAEETWPLTRVLEVADAATGAAVLGEEYEKMGLSPGTVDLGELWKRLGVISEAGGVRFDDDAPQAAIRRSMARAMDSGRSSLGAHSAPDQAASPQKSKK
jgi:hypothetical protein